MSGENLTPITRKEMFLAKAAGQNIQTPTPITREEMFLSKITGDGGVVAFCVVTINDNDYCGPYNVIYNAYENGSIVNKQEVIPNGATVEFLVVQETEMHITVAEDGYSLSSVNVLDKTGAEVGEVRYVDGVTYITVPDLSECFIFIFG